MNFDWEAMLAKSAERDRAVEKRLGDYVPTTDEIETAFHEFAASVTQSELADARLGKEGRSYPPALADWWAGMAAFRRWLAAHDSQVAANVAEKLLSEGAVEAAARRMGRDAHGGISSHDSVRTKESDQAEIDASGYGAWDSGRIVEQVKDGHRRRAMAALDAAVLSVLGNDSKDSK